MTNIIGILGDDYVVVIVVIELFDKLGIVLKMLCEEMVYIRGEGDVVRVNEREEGDDGLMIVVWDVCDVGRRRRIVRGGDVGLLVLMDEI